MAASSTVASGSVISESPAAGTSVASGSAVNLTVSSGAGAAQHFAYVSNAGDGTISAYSVDGTTGALTPLAGSPIAVAGAIQLYEAKVDPSGKFLYVVDNSATGPMDIYAFSIDAGTGALTAVAGSPFAGGNQPQSLAFDASGAYLYVANVTDNSISAYSISSTTGVLTQLSGSPFTVSGTNPAPEQIVRAGNYLYTVNSNTNAVDVFAINTGTGALTEGVAGSPFATDTGPFSLVVDPSGAVLYTANVGASSNGSISAFTINSSTGVLSAVAGNPLAIQVSNYLAIDPHSKFLFVTLITGGVAAYPINAASGVLGTAAAGSPFATGTNSYSVTVDPSGQFVYVCNDGSANVSEFSLAAGTGVLTPIAGSPVSAGANPDFIAIN
jgi:6-phosphogluconolactonase (cycloisomerase 2 family)